MDLIAHLFLPRKLPGEESSHLEEEEKLLKLLSKVVANFNAQANLLPHTNWMLQQWCHLQASRHGIEQHLATALQNLENNQSLALYIRKQNAGLMITRQSDTGSAIISSFPASLKSDAVMSSAMGHLVEFPSQTIKIPFSTVLCSRTLAGHLQELCNTECVKAMPVFQKAQASFVNVQDVADPVYITEWLTALLMDATSTMSPEFPRIFKKVRDNVVWQQYSEIPFRRSGLWMTCKVALQISLIKEVGETRGKALYKMIVLELLRWQCLQLIGPLDGTSTQRAIDADIALQMISKVARRMVKLRTYYDAHEEELGSPSVWSNLLITTLETVETVRRNCDEQWTTLIEEDRRASCIDTISIDSVQDLIQQLPSSGKYFFEEEATAEPMAKSRRYQGVKSSWKRHLTGGTIPSFSFQELTNERVAVVFLKDVEHWIINLESNLELLQQNKEFFSGMISLCENYIKCAKLHYAADPLGASRMILISLKLIQVVDKITTSKHPLLLEYEPGLDVGCVASLLLPFHEEMVLARDLETYFMQRVNQARNPSMLDGQTNTERAFAVQFARHDFGMCKCRDELLQLGEQKAREKMAELVVARQKCSELLERKNRLSHQYYVNDEGYHTHERFCTKCNLEMEYVRQNIMVYERPLRGDHNSQFVIVFELLIPPEIACLRDCLYLFQRDIMEAFGPNGNSMNRLWKDTFQVKPFFEGIQQHVHLGSTSASILNVPMSKSGHPMSGINFVVDHGYNCYFNYESKSFDLQEEFKKCTTFQVETTYQNLQWSVNGTSHTQNEVLSRQCQCSPALSLQEFKDFGSLRSGHRLQVRNIYRVLLQNTLSLKQSSVFLLIAQTIWQAEQRSPTTDWWRDSFEDLRDSLFVTKFLDLLEHVGRGHSDNWQDTNAMNVVIILISRILSFADDDKDNEVINHAVRLLKEFRGVAIGWSQKIRKLLQTLFCAPHAEVLKIRLKWIAVSICCALTYFIEPEHLKYVIDNSDDLKEWLLTLAYINENRQLRNMEEDVFYRSLFRVITSTSILIQKHLPNIPVDVVQHALNSFVLDYWSDAAMGTFGKWSPLYQTGEVYGANFTNQNNIVCQLEMDILSGEFLIDGRPVGRLPNSITEHKDFERIFTQIVFDVLPAADGYGSYVTALKYNGSSYTFWIEGSDLKVVERRENGKEFHLFPVSKFTEDLPVLLVRDHSHWWNKREGYVAFRQQHFVDFTNSKPLYRLCLKTRKLHHLSTNRHFFDLSSATYRSIVNVMQRVELAESMLVFYDPDTERIKVELPRMALTFEVGPNNELLSREYRGFRVAPKQQAGFFIGLKQSLLLVSVNTPVSKKIMVVPHGEIVISSGERHQVVTINRAELHTPPFFCFDVDNDLCYVKAAKSRLGWLYLAYLFAATSSPLPDPFTGMTGTEMALSLLQTARCWSGEPLEPAAQRILNSISSLTPLRDFHPNHLKCMETISWPGGLPSLAAHDAFYFVASKLNKDSQRLHFLFPDSGISERKLAVQTCIELNLRAYWQHLTKYNDQGQILPDWMLSSTGVQPQCIIAPKPNNNLSSAVMVNVRILSHLCHSWTSYYSGKALSDLKRFLITDDNLDGVSSNFPVLDTVVAKMNDDDFRNSWLNLYTYARSVVQLSRQAEWAVLLTILAFNDIDVQQLYLLHAIAVNPDFFSGLDPPQHASYTKPYVNVCQKDQVQKTFEESSRPCPDILRTDAKTVSEQKRKAHRKNVENQAELLTNQVLHLWPVQSIRKEQLSNSAIINTSDAIQQLNPLLKRWHNNWELKQFLENVGKAFDRVLHQNKSLPIMTEIVDTHETSCPKSHLGMFKLDFHSMRCPAVKDTTNAEAIFKKGFVQFPEAANLVHMPPNMPYHKESDIGEMPLTIQPCEIGQSLRSNLTNSWNQYVHSAFTKHDHLDARDLALEEEYQYFAKRTASMWEEVKHAFVPESLTPQEIKALVASRLFPITVPMTMLPKMCIVPDGPAWENIRNLLGAYAVLLTQKQRAIRCLSLAKVGKSAKVALQHELATTGHENWSPAEYPEWLIFEVEANLMIRPVQIQVALQMLTPLADSNAVMQLNMGEGKTSVIVPLVALRLSNADHFCRITVLRSLFRINLELLSSNIGGLLNRRVYTFPCQRDMAIGPRQVQQMSRVYEECKLKRGVVLTLPEHRLSFQLKGIEKSRASMTEEAGHFLTVQRWLCQNARDVLDESDEILSVKFQLVYTIGDQFPVAGESLRWIVVQEVISMFKRRLPEIVEKFGHGECQFIECSNLSSSEMFPNCRILNDQCNEEICNMLASDCMNGKSKLTIPEFTTKEKQVLVKFLTKPNLSNDLHVDAYRLFDNNVQETMLILRGILAYGIFCHSFAKRWRVHYGVNPTGHRRMAVPFRAKDVPAERAEFGHPDVAIFLTILSYYYSGLSDVDLEECFFRCAQLQNPEEEYGHWLSEIPREKVSQSIASWSGVNLADYTQRTKHLFPVLRRNMMVINFWLGQFVFPKESKQFAGKIVCTPWDFCSKNTTYPTTGFSGTNESELLLPITISQQALPELQGTNGQVLAHLLREENNTYRDLPAGCSGRTILKDLAAYHLKLLLDVGALMLEFTNEEVAKEWLKLVPEVNVDAAVYFDVSNHLVVQDRKGYTTSLELSTFRERLDRCVIYLDDIHTRGTDLKIPHETAGCVTLAAGLTKDRLVQACMRMRLLGRGHRVCFWASQEAHSAIWSLRRAHRDAGVSSKDVMEWAIDNTRKMIRDGLLHWSVQGSNYLRKTAALDMFEASSKSDQDFATMGNFCTESDELDLDILYGRRRTEEVIPTIVLGEFKKLYEEFLRRGSFNHMPQNEIQLIYNHVSAYVPNVKRFARLLEEEQERELEAELQEERQNVPVGPARAYQPEWSDDVWKFIQTGDRTTSASNCVVPVSHGLKRTTIWPYIQEEAWSPQIFATNNFTKTIIQESDNDTMNQFLRPVNWIVVTPKVGTVLLISPYEANILIPKLRRCSAAVLLMFAAQFGPNQHHSLLSCMELAVTLRKSSVPHPLADFSSVRVQLAVFSGSLYFGSSEELCEYCQVLGFVPRPRTERQQQAFDEGIIDRYGFVRPQDRLQCGLPETNCLFQENPGYLIKSIAVQRHGEFSPRCHVCQIVFYSRNPY